MSSVCMDINQVMGHCVVEGGGTWTLASSRNVDKSSVSGRCCRVNAY